MVDSPLLGIIILGLVSVSRPRVPSSDRTFLILFSNVIELSPSIQVGPSLLSSHELFGVRKGALLIVIFTSVIDVVDAGDLLLPHGLVVHVSQHV